MERAPTRVEHPALLSLGTCVGPWRVVAWAGRGIYGAVYKAVRLGEEHLAPVALKLALLPKDPRFAREAALLSRTFHPSIPRLIDADDWRSPTGTLHPYVTMEWIEGAPLYDWARQYNPTSQQVLGLLSQLADALAALHAQGAVHRDVKGDNVLVRLTDSRAMLTDLGAGNYPGAATLTPQSFFPGTPAYRAPEVWLFPLRCARVPGARYCAEPANDLFSLGVTGYRLLTGEYPSLGEPFKDAAGTWQVAEVTPPPSLVRNPRVEPRLSALILRMLSVHPEQRGTARELAEALEQAAQHPLPTSSRSIYAPQSLPSLERLREELAAASKPKTPVPVDVPRARSSVPPTQSRAHAPPWQRWLATAAVGLTVGAGAWWAAPGKSSEKPSVVQQETSSAGQKDGGTVGLGEAAVAASTEDASAPSALEVLAEDTLPEPLPGQTRPNSKGRCPYKGQVPLNGGCWAETLLDPEACVASGNIMFKSKCYSPTLPLRRQPNSSSAPQQ